MSAEAMARASSGGDWNGINWADVQRHVRRLQARIVKATQAGKHGKARALQWLLTHSFSGRALAVKRVTENQGKNTPGVDKVTWKTSRAKANAMMSLKRRGYSSLPLRRVLIPKKNGKTRPLGIPVMKCRAMQALYLLALEPIAETTADLNSYGFRPERSTADAGEQCFIVLAAKAKAQWVLEADIQGCFDNINHDWMIANIPTDKVVLRKWFKAGYVFQNALFPTEAGTPQGGIISPVLANMVLDGLEPRLRGKFPKHRRELKVNMVRYADDLIVTGYSKEWLEQKVKPVVVDFLAERGLVLSTEKTRITHIAEGFDFLGWNFRKYSGKLLIKPSKANVKAHLDRIREIIKANMMAKQANLIMLLNPILRGWANYHRHMVAKEAFGRNDHNVWSMLWRWAVRRHPNKGARWVKQRYFKTKGSRNWVFAATETKEDGTKREHVLLKESDTPIQRHIKINYKANPHDPAWAQYFESRWGKKMLRSPKGLAKLYRIWLRQDRRCSGCQQPITKNTQWEIRWNVKRAEGGTNAASNLHMHHTNCRRPHQHAKNIHGGTGHQNAFAEA